MDQVIVGLVPVGATVRLMTRTSSRVPYPEKVALPEDVMVPFD
jgi:hypothetical protein